MPHSSHSGSEQESNPPVDLSSHPHGELYSHVDKHVVDAITKNRVTALTTIAALYDCKDATVDKRLLQNLTALAEPAVLCRIEDVDGNLYPPTLSEFYQLKLTYNKLLLAPALRLECDFFPKRGEKGTPYLTVALEFHFNDFDGPETGIQEYQEYPISSDRLLTFKAKGATSSGFNLVAKFKSQMGEQEFLFTEILKSFLKPAQPKTVTLHLHEELLQDDEKAERSKICARLPGGSQKLLPSIGATEYKAFGRHVDHVHSKRGGMQRPMQLLTAEVPHPMVLLESTDTFSTVKEAGVQLAYATAASDAESSAALALWAKKQHRGKLYPYGSFAIVGADFNAFERLGSVTDEITYKLPRDLYTKITFDLPGTGQQLQVHGFLTTVPYGFPAHEACFLVTSQSLEDMMRGISKPENVFAKGFEVLFTPCSNSSTFSSQLETVAQLQKKANSRWHGILLNQVHDVIEAIDLTADVDRRALAEADEWLEHWMEWNPEQTQVIEGIRKAKGGMVIVMGPAGTGKTLLQQALAIYFYKLGFHILALSPANSNADHLATQMKKVGGISGLEFSRLYPGSRDKAPDKMSERQAAEQKAGHDAGNIVCFSELLTALEELDQRGAFEHEYGVVEQVINAAMSDELKLHRRLRDEKGKARGDVTNVWDLLRKYIAAYQDGTFNPKSESEAMEFRMAYGACKGHIIGLNRFMITTTGNVRASDMMENRCRPEKEYGVPRRGVIVFVDEAAKDVEVNVWSGIVCEAWATRVNAVFLFGDDKQLKPTNTSSKDKAIFNAFLNRINISLPCRLIREGFPYYRLREQRRMHWSIASFPNREIYDGEMRDGPGTDKPLHDIKPGLDYVLADIIARYGAFDSMEARASYRTEASDEKARLHYIEVKGDRKALSPSNGSMLVREHVDAFFDKIFPKLRVYFAMRGESVADNVMIICAYGAAVQAYHARIAAILHGDRDLSQADMPRVLTVDSSQGDESFMVIFDGSFQHGDVIGFMTDVGRANVAITRAKEVFWMIGGRMTIKFGCNVNKELLLLTKYKRELQRAGKCHKFL